MEVLKVVNSIIPPWQTEGKSGKYDFLNTNLILDPLKVFRKSFKGTLMQIWKCVYMLAFIWKQYSENFAYLIIGNLELFAREVC